MQGSLTSIKEHKGAIPAEEKQKIQLQQNMPELNRSINYGMKHQCWRGQEVDILITNQGVILHLTDQNGTVSEQGLGTASQIVGEHF